MNALTSLSVMASGYDPGITPNFNAPWMPSVQSVGGMIVATAIVLLGIVIVIGAVLWVAGKLGAGGTAQSAGLSVLAWGVAAAVIIGSIGGIISWATGIPLFA
jgi:small multidrug resistance pump